MGTNKFLEELYQYYFPLDTGLDINMKQLTFLLSKLTKYCSRTADHCIRVSSYSMLLAKHLNISRADIKTLWKASLFHDVGKITIPKCVLDKPSKLTSHEYDVIKNHSLKGCLIVSKYESIMDSRHIILFHHERYDGKGYPIGISGKEIPFLSRLISVCDAFDAMTSERPYNSLLSFEEAKRELDKNKWKQFDGEIVDAFLNLLNEYKQIKGELRLFQGLDCNNPLSVGMS